MKLQRIIKLDKKDIAKFLLLKEKDIERMFGVGSTILIYLKEKESRQREEKINNLEEVSK